MFFHARQHKLQLDDLQMNYITFGRGTKPLIMIQGLNTRSLQGMALPLAWMYRIFAADYKVWLFDRRENLPPEVTIADLTADLARAMDGLGIRDADVLGVSQGGMIAQQLAIDRPDLVRRMVLAVTLARNNETVTDVLERWIDLTRRGDWKALVEDMTVKMYSPSYVSRYRPLLPLLTLLQKPKDVRRFLTLAHACLTCTAYDRLDRITCPTLVIGGAEDRVVGSNASVEIAEKLGCALYLYPGLGHAAYEEAPDFNRRVLDFLRK